MALANFSLPFAGATTQNWAATISPLQPHYATAVNNLLYGPAGHQQETDESSARHQDYYKNDPYAPPQNHQFRPRTNNNYLPPPPPPSSHPNQQHHHHQHHHSRDQQYNNNGGHPTYNNPATGYGDGRYSHVPTRSSKSNTPQYFNGYNTQTRTYEGEQTISVRSTTEATPPTGNSNGGESRESGSADSSETGGGYPERLPGYTRVQAGGQGSRTQVHAVLDYDAEEDEEGDYYEDRDGNSNNSDSTVPTVTPIQGPIFLKNGTVPVVPLFSYPTIKNGTFVQIPIWWTALSVALGLDVRGDIIRGVPCVKRHHQLFCPTAGNSYPIEKIEQFIDDNKALMRRMYGDFEMTSQFGGQRRKRKRSIDEPDFADLQDAPSEDYDFFSDVEEGDTYFGKWREKRQSTPSFRNNNNNGQNNPRNQNSKPPNRRGPGSNPEPENSTGRVDVCESKIEIVTPYWASNSAGKIRAIVNTQHFEQAIHQEICTKPQTGRCGKDCGCEQKYKWHRLLAYDPDNDCKGIFMDWFLFPSCCVCRCSPT